MSKSTRKPVSVKRTLKVVKPVDADGHGHIWIIQIRGSRVEHDSYLLQTFPAFDGSAVGVRVEHLLEETVYNCCVASDRTKSTCECLGFLHHRHCKHVDCLHARWTWAGCRCRSPTGRRPTPSRPSGFPAGKPSSRESHHGARTPLSCDHQHHRPGDSDHEARTPSP